MRTQKIAVEYKEKCQQILKSKIEKLISEKGLAVAEYQVEFLANNSKTTLPTVLSHRETLRIYQLTIIDYKKKLEGKN